jgi:hypothetical protein
MISGPENKVKAKVKKLLDAYKIFNFPIAASPYGTAGISDRLGVLPDGRFLAVECKAPGKKATALQAKFLGDVNKNRGLAFLIDGDAALRDLEQFLKDLRRVYAS